MDIGENIFLKFWNLRKRIGSSGKAPANLARVNLADVENRLSILARALTGEHIRIKPAELEGGYAGHSFYLPQFCDRYESTSLNTSFYIFRTVFLCALKLHERRAAIAPPQGLEAARKHCSDLSESILQQIKLEFEPFFENFQALIEIEQIRFAELSQCFWLWGRWLTISSNDLETKAVSQSNYDDEKKEDDGIQTEIQGVVRENVEILNVDRQQQEDYTLSHNFEKCLTADDFNGNWRDFDGEDEAKDHQNALDELEMNQVVRVNETVHSVLRSQIRLLTNTSQVAKEKKARGIPMDEWDYKKRTYRKDHCHLYASSFEKVTPGSARQILKDENQLLHRLRKKFSRILQERETVRRTLYGEDLDLDAMTDSYAETKAGRSPLENIYISKRRRRLDLAVSFLIDISLSTDAYNSGEKILDLEKKSLVVFGEILNEFSAEFAINCFYSETRNNCNFVRLKTFDQSWESSRDRITALAPIGYTRIGPALRFASAQLAKESTAKNRWLIMITDGNPNDYDQYEGNYGIHDVKQAVHEAKKMGIRVVGMALDASAKSFFPMMMGGEPHQILKHPQQLPQTLEGLYGNMLKKL